MVNKKQRARKEGARARNPEGPFPVTYFLQPGPTLKVSRIF
jgi:hypothetical protein